jgi:hypothetical protein
MNKPERSETAAPAVGFPVDCPVGRPVPERARLAADVARCAGYRADGELREGCDDCRRRTDAPHERQVHMMPPHIVVFECHARIAPCQM